MSAILVRLNAAEAMTFLGEIGAKLRDSGKFQIVVARALNRTMTFMKKRIKQDIYAQYNAKQQDIESTMTVKQAKKGRLVASIAMRGRMSLDLIKYGARETRKGVSVRVLRASKAHVIKPGWGKGGIRATKKNKASATWIAKDHVLARVKGIDHPVMLWGPSFMAVVARQAVRDDLQAEARGMFEKRLQHEAAFELEKLAGKS